MGGLSTIRIHPDQVPDWDESQNVPRPQAPSPFDAYANLNPTAFTWDPIKRGAQQIASMPQIEASDPYEARAKLSNQYASGLANVVGGAGALAMPVMGPLAFAEAPLAFMSGLGGGTLAQQGTEWLGEKAGVPEGERKLVGLGAGLVGGAASEPIGATAPEWAPRVGTGIADAARRTVDLIDQLNYNTQMGSEAGAVKLGPDKPQVEAEPTAEPAQRDVKARSLETLEQRIPQSIRTASADPTRTINGGRFSDLDLTKPGVGFLPLRQYGPEIGQQMNVAAWEKAIQDSEIGNGTAAREAVALTGARPPSAQFLDDSFSYPEESRYWYETSGEAATGDLIDVPREMQPTVIDTIAATSPGAEPYRNMQRTIGVLAENAQKQPIMTDLRSGKPIRVALSSEPTKGLKIGNFGGTMKYTTGLTDRAPISTNDVQQADVYGIKGTDFGKHPVLYEVVSRHNMYLRDMQNALTKPGEQPWEVWQIQAPPWVHNRIVKNPLKAGQYDTYRTVLRDRIIPELQAAGIPTPGGKITMETLMDPRVPNLMSGTREQFLGTPTGTLEVATKLTPEGARAMDIRNELASLDPNHKALAGYDKVQHDTLRALMSRKGGDEAAGIPAEPSLISRIMSGVVGRKVDVSRLDRGAWGTFESPTTEVGLNPNLLIPMTGRGGQEFVNMNPVQINAMLSMLGKAFNQEAVPASLFTAIEPGTTSPATHSVFLQRYDGVVDKPAIINFRKELGHDLTVKQMPNGVVLGIHRNQTPEGAWYGPTSQAVWDAAKRNFGQDPNVQDMGVIANDYNSYYAHNDPTKAGNYKENLNAWRKQTRQELAARAADVKSRGSGQTWDPQERTGYLNAALQDAGTLAKLRDQNFATWSDSTEPILAKLRASQASASRPAVAGGPRAELPPTAQTGQLLTPQQRRPPPNLDLQQVVNQYHTLNGLPPVDHSQYHPIDEDFGQRVARAYDALKGDNSADPRVQAAYGALARETAAQFQHLTNSGYKLEPWTQPGQPYANSHEMTADLANNKHLYFFTGGEPHPFLSAIDPKTGLSYNDLFRAVHDAWAHAAGGYGFGPRGEEMAHDLHSQSFSPLAQQAMTTETRGQNSWVNFGRQNYDDQGRPLGIPAAEKPYAQQKVDLLPTEMLQRAGDRVSKTAPRKQAAGAVAWDAPIQPAVIQGGMRTEHPSTGKIVRAAEKEMAKRGFDIAYLRRAYGDTLEEGRVGTSEDYGTYLQNYLRRKAGAGAPAIPPPNMARGGLYYAMGGLHGKYDRMRSNMLAGLMSSPR